MNQQAEAPTEETEKRKRDETTETANLKRTKKSTASVKVCFRCLWSDLFLALLFLDELTFLLILESLHFVLIFPFCFSSTLLNL